jgi:1-deoxy-D-xylulose-5-phosphate reductoisomerase
LPQGRPKALAPWGVAARSAVRGEHAYQRRISVLGATGSIGASALGVIGEHPDRFAVAALTAHSQWEKLAQLCLLHRPDLAVLVDPDAALRLERALAGTGLPTRVLAGDAGLVEAACWRTADTVVAAIVGAAGLRSTMAAANAGKRILLANKRRSSSAAPRSCRQ